MEVNGSETPVSSYSSGCDVSQFLSDRCDKGILSKQALDNQFDISSSKTNLPVRNVLKKKKMGKQSYNFIPGLRPPIKSDKRKDLVQNIDSYHPPNHTPNIVDGVMSPPEFNVDEFPFLPNKGVCMSDISIEQSDEQLGEIYD